ncbi:DUF4199 domain-containing protein [Pedobacter sandarakinus]|uniref:DUF4199 domain-containing protein n=1 Tax=Pedobacter sandarakinus TaxID=353156 RepID=UPI002245CD2E|nr:DUF4199 domain-containing protein [Pedobacter sandarakinus]MCX2575324.1 DUF4199 domain-containing protein [Pedobacter sandarakinus]
MITSNEGNAQPKVYEEIFKSGLILGIAMFILGISLLFVMQGADSFWSLVIIYPAIFLFLAPVTLSVFVIRSLRKNIGGYWTFRQALKSIFIVFFVGWLVSFGLNLLYTKVIDTTATEKMQDHIKERTLTFMKDKNVDQEELDKQRANMDEQFAKQNELTAGSLFKNITIGISIIFVFALIFAAIFKKERPLRFEEFPTTV